MVAIRLIHKSANPPKFLNNYLICSVLILISFNTITSIPTYVPDTFGQLASTNSTVLSNSFGQLEDFKIAASQEFLSPLLLVPIDAVGDDVFFAWSSNKTGNFEYFLLGAPTKEKLLKTQLTLVTRLMQRQRMSRLRQRETMCMFHGGKITKTHRGFPST